MTPLSQVDLRTYPLDRFREFVEAAAYESALAVLERSRELLAGRTVWHVNSTAEGGGVAEMLRSLLAYARGTGIDARWAVIEGEPEFFRITKRLHHALHGSAGDGSPLAEEAARVYGDVLAPNIEAFLEEVRPGDAVFLHDPQTAGMAPALMAHGATVIWRCTLERKTSPRRRRAAGRSSHHTCARRRCASSRGSRTSPRPSTTAAAWSCSHRSTRSRRRTRTRTRR